MATCFESLTRFGVDDRTSQIGKRGTGPTSTQAKHKLLVASDLKFCNQIAKWEQELIGTIKLECDSVIEV